MTFPFKIIEHVLPGQHIREYYHSVKGRQESIIQIAIKQYIPLDLLDPISKDAITIIAVPGNAAPKEAYEPLWEDLYACLKEHSIPLRGIWIADVSNQGASGVLNEHVQGDTSMSFIFNLPSNWYDHSRDLLHMVNHFRAEMPRPIIGIAHSMGCAQLTHLTILHPRLLSTLLLYEPVMGNFKTYKGPNPSTISSQKPDLWPTQASAESYLRSRAAKKWDPRVLDRYIRFALRPVPTPLYNPATDTTIPTSAVTLTTTKHQEAWAFSTPNLEPEEAGLDRLLLPDWSPVERGMRWGRPEFGSAMRNLPFVRASVLWVFGERSWYSGLEEVKRKVGATGVSAGGNGGVRAGMVEKVVLMGGSHTLTHERVGWCADVGADWIRRWFESWRVDEGVLGKYRSKRSVDGEMVRLSEAAVRVMQMPVGVERLKAKL
ncbi:hypothetical protein BBP40_004686 [Aspergillus hancockii]|nr:hypothetical protein BBP40_004686 [Aspergillus hancockii]